MLNSGVSLQRLATKAGVGFTPKKLFSNGEAGVWYDPSDVEASLTWRRNLLKYTESFDNNFYGKGSNTVVTANHGVAPNGTQTADRLEMPAQGSTYINCDIPVTNGSVYTYSVYIKSTSGTSNFSLFYNFNGTVILGQQTATSEWQRFDYTVTASSTTGRFGINNGGDTYASDILIWGAQVEEGSTATEYQPIRSTFDNAFKQAFPKHTLYQNEYGKTPVTQLGQAVGLMLDKSEGVALGNELVTNGDFATDLSGWSGAGWVWSNGKAYDSGSSVVVGLLQTLSTTAEKFYALKFTLSNVSGGHPGLYWGGQLVTTYSADVTDEVVIVKATSGSTNFELVGGNATFFIDNVSVKEVLGSHATQSDSTKRPVFARHPERGRVNVFTHTEELDNGAWSKLDGATVTANAGVAPNGTQTADRINFSTNVLSRVENAVPISLGANVTVTYSIWLKSESGTQNLQIGTSGTSKTSVTATTEWQRFTHTTTDADGNVFPRVENSDDGVARSVLSWGWQLEEANEATGYQKVVDDYDITESGYKSVYYLQFDGINDGMRIQPITSSVKPLTVLLGYSATNMDATAHRFLLDIATGRTVLGTDSNGTFGYHDGTWRTVSTVDENAIKVLTYDLVVNNAKMRENGIQFYSDTTYDEDAVSGDIGLFGRYSLDNHFVAGNLYQFVLRAAESTDKEIDQAEEFVAIKTGLKSEVVGLATLDLNFGANTYTARNSNGSVL
jgi:hypothetical protein